MLSYKYKVRFIAYKPNTTKETNHVHEYVAQDDADLERVIKAKYKGVKKLQIKDKVRVDASTHSNLA